MRTTLPTPSKHEVTKYLKLWDSLENYVLQERALEKLFFETCPKNNNIEDILVKVAVLNDFYSTNIFSVFPVAKHILELNIDERLNDGDTTLVNDIAVVQIAEKTKHFYSFATKYCSHHLPTEYPIYDRYVDKVLMQFKRQDHFAAFQASDLKDYASFKDILITFRDFYGIGDYNLKDIDRYLWQLGKEHYTIKY